MTSSSSPPVESGSVLYVDADSDAAFAMSRFLRRVDAGLREEHTLEGARRALREATPALLILDPDLPDGDGCDLIREVRAREPWVQIFVACSAARAEHASTLISSGASDIALKPFDVGTLPGRAQRLLRAAHQARREIAYRQHLETRLQHAERIATLGTLCATVAHEVANPLSLIVGNADVLAQTLLESATPARETIDMLAEASHDILVAARLIESFITRIRVFSRRSDERRSDGSLGEVVETALLLLKPRLLSRGISVVRPTAAPPQALHFPIRLTQALLNVLTNAMEASDDRARIAIEYVERPDAIGIVVDDEGPGLPPELSPNPAQPFFTTKADGTGLGLMVIRTIMREHGGRFELVERKPRGMRARLLLPRNPAVPLVSA